MADTDKWDEMVSVGRIARPHGNRGRVIVDPDSDFIEERFAPGKAVFIRQGSKVTAYCIEDVRFHRGRPIIGLDGVVSISMAEVLASAALRVPRIDVAALPPGQYYRHELIGCRVETVEGDHLGVVTDIEEGEGAERLILCNDGNEVQIPLVDAICVLVDVAARRIEVAPPDGLVELKRPRA